MGFLAPWFLAGMAMLGLPVWLHLLRQHKTTPRDFASLMFFERRTQSSIKHRRLKYLLLMILRLLVLLFLVLAFAAPFLRHMGPLSAGGRKLLVVAVDNSASMRTAGRLERAKREAISVLAGRGAREQAQVLAIGSGVQAMTQTIAEPNELRAAVEAIKPSDSHSSYGELARALRSLEQSATSMPPAFTDLRLGPSTKLVVHSMADKTIPNYAVESVNAPRSVFDTKKARVQVTVASYHGPKAKREVSLRLNGKTTAVKTVEIPENGRASVEFLGLDANYGFNKAEARIAGGDESPSDDVYYFSVERADPKRVLFVHDGRQPKGLLYYRAALESATEGAFAVDGLPADQSANVSPNKYSFVVVSDTAILPGGFEEALKNYVRGGGSALIAAGPAMAGRTRIPVFDEAIRETRYASRAGERYLVAGQMDLTHPALKSAAKWESVKFYQAARIEPGQARVVARLADATPLLLEKRIGEGRVMVFASTFDNISNDFPLHPAFVPFVEQGARYLAGSEARPSSYTVDASVDLRAEKGAGTVEVLDPHGKRALDLKEASSAQSFLLREVGYYDIGRGNDRHELVAVNADRKESDLELMPKDSVDLWQGTGSKTGAPAAGSKEEQDQQTSNLWWYAMLAAVLLALAESVLASRYLDTVPADA
ncbi:MAG: BatA domain-containing protein [Candidatus Solibacter usitatus]|nr:BatA domain-containing protein [Candidatus Solibacter usitatus]